MMACNVFAADTEAEAQFYFSTLLQAFVGMVTNRRGLIAPPIENYHVPENIRPHVEGMLQGSAVGTPEQVAERLSIFHEKLAPDEFILSMPFYEQAARLRSMELVMGVREKIGRLGEAA